jgi:hypothetical protein
LDIKSPVKVLAIKYKFDFADHFDEGYAKVKFNQEWRRIDTGRFID